MNSIQRIEAEWIFGVAYGAYAQSEAPQFEVAEVQVNKLGQNPSVEMLPSGQVTLRGLLMSVFIRLAYQEVYSDDYIKGAPGWFATASTSWRKPPRGRRRIPSGA